MHCSCSPSCAQTGAAHAPTVPTLMTYCNVGRGMRLGCRRVGVVVVVMVIMVVLMVMVMVMVVVGW